MARPIPISDRFILTNGWESRRRIPGDKQGPSSVARIAASLASAWDEGSMAVAPNGAHAMPPSQPGVMALIRD
jgi:hypothetical protein